MINPYLLQILAMRQRGMNPYASTAMDYPQDDIYGMSPWAVAPSPVEPYGGMPEPGAPQTASFPEFDEAGAQQRARRAGLGALGVALLAGAGKGDYAGSLAEGLAAMAATRQQRFQEERGQFRQDAQDRLARDAYDRQNRMTEAQIRNYGADNERARMAAEAQSEGLRAEIAKQEEFVASLPPDLQTRLKPLIGTKELYPTYVEATKPKDPEKPIMFDLSPGETRYAYQDGKVVPIMSRPPAPDRGGSGDSGKAPTTRPFSDGTTRQWNPETKSWDVLARSTPNTEQIHDDIATAFDRRYNAWLRLRMEGVGKPIAPDKATEVLDKGFEGIPIKKGPTEMFIKLPNGARITEDEYFRRKFRKEAEEEVRLRHRAAGQQRTDMNIYYDSEGNPLE